MDNNIKDLKLEELFERLNNIIGELEKPDISLESSFELYQEGIRLVRHVMIRSIRWKSN